MNRRTLNQVLLYLSCAVLLLVFGVAVGAKLYTFKDFVASMSELVGAWAFVATVALLFAEAAVVLLLLFPKTRVWGASLAAMLLIAFSSYALFYVYVLKGEPLECGCFGKLIGSQLGLTTALRNLALLVPAAAIIFLTRHKALREFV